MRKIAISLILTMVFGSLVGCLGSEDDDSPLVGDWFVVSDLIVEMRADGYWTSPQGEGSTGTWSVSGDMISITSDVDENQTAQFNIYDGWLWMRFSTEDGDMCVVYSPDSMTQELWDFRMESITPPSLCDDVPMAN